MSELSGPPTRQGLQEAQYSFPYHWIANDDDGYWTTCRAVPGAFAYLALLGEVGREVTALRPRTALDFGCGDGRLAHRLAHHGVAEVTGIDLSAQAIAFAQAFPAPLGLTFQCLAIESSPLRRHDVVVAMEVLEHIPDAQLPAVVHALRERTHVDGHLVVSVPTTNVPTSPKHERHYTVSLLDEQLSPCFTRVSARYVNRVTSLATAIDRLAANRVFAMRHRGALRLVTRMYQTHVTAAAADTGANLIAVYRPVS